jgi:hypothetical protein
LVNEDETPPFLMKKSWLTYLISWFSTNIKSIFTAVVRIIVNRCCMASKI